MLSLSFASFLSIANSDWVAEIAKCSLCTYLIFSSKSILLNFKPKGHVVTFVVVK